MVVPTRGARTREPAVLQPNLAGNWEQEFAVWTGIGRQQDPLRLSSGSTQGRLSGNSNCFQDIYGE